MSNDPHYARKPCIASIFMRNIDQKTVELQRSVVNKFNKSNIQFYHLLTDGSHGATMTQVIPMLKERGHDAIMFLDIDCVPVNYTAIDYMFNAAYNGKLVGDAQRSNHIENDQHVFCGAHNITFTVENYEKMGKPSFEPTPRGDVAEELTWKARESNIDIEILMPLKYDAPPIRMAWETNAEPFWRLADGMPNYGIGTTYGKGEEEMFWHCWQIFHPGQQERFWTKCEELLNG